MPLRRLILGGSFNPIHHAHLICARAAAERAGFDRVILMPSAIPPHKQPLAQSSDLDPSESAPPTVISRAPDTIRSAAPAQDSQPDDLAPVSHRYRMCELAISDLVEPSLFELSRLEIDRSGPSYTIDTLRELRRQASTHNVGSGPSHPDNAQIAWLIGADMLRTLPTWHEPAALLSEVHFIPIARPGWSFDWDSMPAAYRHLRHAVIEVPQIDISATLIRRRVAAGLPIDFLTPPSVCRYIREHRLYTSPPSIA